MDAEGGAKVPCRDQPTDEANVAAQDASAGTPSLEPEGHPPSSESIRDYLVYGLSLPERAIRSTAGVVGGALRESAAALIPQTFRNARTYQLFVGQMLDFLAEDVGGVARPDQPEDPRVENYVARKTVGNFVEMASLATVHVSPMLLLAIVSDLAYGSNRTIPQQWSRDTGARQDPPLAQVDNPALVRPGLEVIHTHSE